MRLRTLGCISALFALTFSHAFTQESLKSIEEEYYDFLSLTGITDRPTLGYRTLSDSKWVILADGGSDSTQNPEDDIWQNNNLGTTRTLFQSDSEGENFFTGGFSHSIKARAYGPEWFGSYNAKSPFGQNDGALWQGKGFNTSLSLGANIEAYGFSLTVKPQVSWSQNKDFDLMPSSDKKNEYGYYQGGIDLPQRFGDGSFWAYDWGDSEVRYTWRTVTVGMGTQSPWLGPAWLNPMLGSNNAASYPKIDAGIRRTSVYMPHFGWHIGDIEGRIWLGRLEESDYFDGRDDNDYRLLTAVSASFAPSFVPGLTIGVNRIFTADWAAHNLKYIGRLFTLSHSNGSQVGTGEDEDQKLALFADWQFQKVGFEVYGELGLDDFTSDELSNPFHTAIYTVGARQSIPIPESLRQLAGALRSQLIFEWNNFEMSQDFQMQWPYTGYYSHSSIAQGYTHKGQILGAGSGYAGNSQLLAYKIYHGRGSVMLFFHRFCPDNNYIYNKSVGKALSSDSPEYMEYYASFKTFRTYGIEVTHFFTKSLVVTGKVSKIFTAHTRYDDSSETGFSIALTGKYNF